MASGSGVSDLTKHRPVRRESSPWAACSQATPPSQLPPSWGPVTRRLGPQLSEHTRRATGPGQSSLVQSKQASFSHRRLMHSFCTWTKVTVDGT